MQPGQRHCRAIRVGADGPVVEIIDRTRLPHEVLVRPLPSLGEVASAICTCGWAARR